MPDFVKKEGAPTGDFRSDNNFLLGYFEEKDHSLYYRYDAERVIIEPWGDNSFRVHQKCQKCRKNFGHWMENRKIAALKLQLKNIPQKS